MLCLLLFCSLWGAVILNTIFTERHINSDHRRILRFFAVWIIGLILGISFVYVDVPLFTSLMRLAFCQQVSIVGFFICIFFPLFCSAFFLAIGKPCFLLIICFVKAVAFAFCGASLCVSFRSAGWLAVLLFLFSDCLFLFFLFRFWLCGDKSRESIDTQLYWCLIAGLMISGIDRIAVHPILQRVS